MTTRTLVVALIAVLAGSSIIAGGQNSQSTALNYDTFAPEAYRAGMPGLVMPVRVHVTDPAYTTDASKTPGRRDG